MLPEKSIVLDSALAFVHGEKWLGLASITFTDLATNLPPTGSTLVSATLEFRPKGSKTIVLTLSTPSDIVIVSASDWSLRIPERSMPELITGEYDYRFKTVDSNSRTQSWIDGIQVVAPSYP